MLESWALWVASKSSNLLIRQIPTLQLKPLRLSWVTFLGQRVYSNNKKLHTFRCGACERSYLLGLRFGGLTTTVVVTTIFMAIASFRAGMIDAWVASPTFIEFFAPQLYRRTKPRVKRFGASRR